MKQVKYILVNETVCKNAHCDVTYRDVPHIGHCVVVDNAGFRFQDSGSKCSGGSKDLKLETWNLEQRNALLAKLCKLRRHWPEAPILGVSEIDLSASHAPIRVSEAMNQLRRELSDLP